MSVVTVGLIVSISLTFLLWVLFSYEARVGRRFIPRARTYLDFIVLRIVHAMHRFVRFIGTDFVRQVFHYVFHTILRAILMVMRKGEHALQNIMRVNKTLAKTAEKESETMSKLEEIALHKVASALTEKQKQAHKDKILSGK